MTWYVGIDPGVGGAVALLSNEGALVETWRCPTFEPGGGKKGREYEVEGMARILDHDIPRIMEEYGSSDRVFVAIEEVTFDPRGGSKLSTFALMKLVRCQGLWEGFCVSLGLGHELVRPQTWKAQWSLNGKDKEASRQAAFRLWPDAKETFLRFSKDEGMAEAALMAEWARRRNS